MAFRVLLDARAANMKENSRRELSSDESELDELDELGELGELDMGHGGGRHGNLKMELKLRGFCFGSRFEFSPDSKKSIFFIFYHPPPPPSKTKKQKNNNK